jgi:AcrR family transcriptional regulator
MNQQPAKPLTRKGEQTREHILDTALQLFQTQGYEATTMRDIASVAGSSLGLTYRYFDHKEELVLALYMRLAHQLETLVETLPKIPLAERFGQAMRAKIALVTPYREPLGALFGAALTPHSELAVLGTRTAEVRRRVSSIFLTVVIAAADAPRRGQAEQLATLLYAAHLGLLLYWLHDRTPGQQATHDLLTFTCEALALIRPVLALPPVAKILARLAQALTPVIGGQT